MQSVIEVKSLSKRFDNKLAVNQLNFSLDKGEIFGFLGPSGAGKSSTIKLLTSQITADEGEFNLLGKVNSQLNYKDLEKIAVVSDQSGYYEKLSVYKNLLVYAKIHNISSNRLDELLNLVGLIKEKNKKAEHLSTGMRQRMLLARALINEPKILFLDEPTTGLDPITRKKIHKLLIDLRKKGTTIFLTTHDMDEANFLCDRLVLLNNGRIVEMGTPEELIKRYNKNKNICVITEDGIKKTLPFELITSLKETENIFSIHSCEPTIEDVFINVTGVSLNEEI